MYQPNTHTLHYHSAIKRICSNLGELREYHTKWDKSKKDKFYIISLTCVIWEILQMSPLIKQTDSDIEKKLMVIKRERDEGDE